MIPLVLIINKCTFTFIKIYNQFNSFIFLDFILISNYYDKDIFEIISLNVNPKDYFKKNIGRRQFDEEEIPLSTN